MKKKLILVTSPPASGKTYISKMLATNLDHVVYLDKDTLVPLSNVVFNVAGEEVNRSSDFFEEYIRDVEYEVTLNFAFEAIQYEDIVLINAPFTREIRNTEYMVSLRKKLREYGASLTVVWVQTDVEVCKQRMIERNSPRDTWKIANWDEYISGINFNIPENLNDPSVVDQLLIFKNSSQEEYEESMAKMLKEIQ